MKTIRRVLLVEPYGIGDLLFLTPVLRALRLVPNVEKVDLLLGSRTEEVVRANPHVDEIFTVDKDRFHGQGRLQTFREILLLGKKLCGQKYDLLLDYSLRSEYSFFSQFFLGIPRRAGFDFKRRGFFQTRRLSIPQGFAGAGRHVADYFCDLAELAGIPVEDRSLEFYLTASQREQAKRLLQEKIKRCQAPVPGTFWDSFVVVSPGGGESWGKDAHFKRWPVRFFGEFLKRLGERVDFDGLLVLGSPSERELGEELKKLVPVSCVNLAGEISLTEAAALMENAALFVGNDGGLVHVAHALRVPVIAFYGPVDPEAYGPYPRTPDAAAVFKEGLECRPCYKAFRYNSACTHRDCLQALTPEEVIAGLEAKHFFNNILCAS